MSGPFCKTCEHFLKSPLGGGGGECTDVAKRISVRCGDFVNSAPFVLPDYECSQHSGLATAEQQAHAEGVREGMKYFNPKLWTNDMLRAWHHAIPDLYKAFAELSDAIRKEMEK